MTAPEDVYGIRLENTGEGFIEGEPDWEVEPEGFIWTENITSVDFDTRSEKEWLEMLEDWLADESSDAAFSLRAFNMDSHDLDKEAIVLEHGDMNTFEQCIRAALLLNDEFMRAAHYQNETSPLGKVLNFSVIVRFNDTGVLDYALWPSDKNFNATWNHVKEQLQSIIEWFAPRRDEAKIHRYTSLRRRIVGEYHPHQIIIEYAPQPLSAHERTEYAAELNRLISQLTDEQAKTLRQLVLSGP